MREKIKVIIDGKEMEFTLLHELDCSNPNTGREWKSYHLVKSKKTRLFHNPYHTSDLGWDYRQAIQPESMEVEDGKVTQFNASYVRNDKPTYGLYDFVGEFDIKLKESK